MTSDKKIEGFDEAAASSVGADMACKYASDFVFNASGVYYIQVNSFVDGARWQWQQAQSRIREMEGQYAACAEDRKVIQLTTYSAEDYMKLQRRVAELEAEVLESEKLWGVQNEKKKEYRQQVDTILDEKRILEAESARLRSGLEKIPCNCHREVLWGFHLGKRVSSLGKVISKCDRCVALAEGES